MAIHKDIQGNLHDDMNGEALHMLPRGCVEISADELAAIRTPMTVPPTYAMLRAAEYPPASDYLDAVVKGDTAQMQAYISECLSVKSKYPKV